MAFTLVGSIFTIMGGFFLGTIVLIAFLLGWDLTWIFILIFGLIGLIFLILGITFLTINERKRKMAQKLLDGGRFVWGTIQKTDYQYNVTVNGRHPACYIAIVESADGTTHVFRSGSVSTRFVPDLQGRQVRIYIEDDSYKNYYVDLEPLLATFQEY